MIIYNCIGGFTQDTHTENGIIKLSERLRQYHCDGFSKRVAFYRWDSNWYRIAEYHYIISEMYTEHLTICIFAYSWGAGWGAVQLAKHLRRTGLDVRVMVLSDPVYRHPNIFLKWLSLFGRDWNFNPTITIPPNVEEVFSFHQNLNIPQGHKVITQGTTILHPSHYVHNMVHQKMDSNWMFHGACMEVAKRVENNEMLLDLDLESMDIIRYRDQYASF